MREVVRDQIIRAVALVEGFDNVYISSGGYWDIRCRPVTDLVTTLIGDRDRLAKAIDAALAVARTYKRQHDDECNCEGCDAYHELTDEVEGPLAAVGISRGPA